MRAGRGEIRVFAKYGEWEADAKVELAPRVGLLMLRPERFILEPGEEFRLDLVVRNEGNSCLREGWASIEYVKGIRVLDPRKKKPIPLVRPGREALVSWRAKAGKVEALDALAGATVRWEEEAKSAEAKVFVLRCLPEALKRLPGRLGPFKLALMATDVAGLQTERARLLFPRTKFGFGTALLQVRRQGEWETVAKTLSFARLTFKPPGGKRVDKGRSSRTNLGELGGSPQGSSRRKTPR